jgi:hypothetical protein
MDGFARSLNEHQQKFKDYVRDYFFSELPAPKRFYFLMSVNHELSKIRSKYGNAVKETNLDFFQQWEFLIEDTRQYISINIETLKFQRKCPAHMLAEPVQSFPLCKWMAQKIDLSEVVVGIFLTDAIRLQDGSRPSFTLFLKSIGNVFGITFKHPEREMQRVLERKNKQTDFMKKIISVIEENGSK